MVKLLMLEIIQYRLSLTTNLKKNKRGNLAGKPLYCGICEGLNVIKIIKIVRARPKSNNNIQGIFDSVVFLVSGRFAPLYTKKTTLSKTPDVKR